MNDFTDENVKKFDISGATGPPGVPGPPGMMGK